MDRGRPRADRRSRRAARARPRRPDRAGGASRRQSMDDAAFRTVSELGVGGFLTASQLAERYGGGSSGTGADDGGEPRTFGHVLVDEAQDLSPMQWRMIARRCPSGSMTLVGDFGQASQAGCAVGLERGARARAHARGRAQRRPQRQLPHAGRDHGGRRAGPRRGRRPRSTPSESVRAPGATPGVRRRHARRLWSPRSRPGPGSPSRGPGTKAIIAPAALHDALVAELADIGAVVRFGRSPRRADRGARAGRGQGPRVRRRDRGGAGRARGVRPARPAAPLRRPSPAPRSGSRWCTRRRCPKRSRPLVPGDLDEPFRPTQSTLCPPRAPR